MYSLSGLSIKGRLYSYTIHNEFSNGLYSTTLKVQGNFEEFDSGISVIIAISQQDNTYIPIERFYYNGLEIYVYSINRLCIYTKNWINLGQQIYNGYFVNGIPHGRGEMRWQNSALYSGEWHNGIISGFGIMIWPDGNRYEGEWLNNKMDGKGVFFYSNGDIYNGCFSNGVKEGNGIIRKHNGEYEEGRFSNDILTEHIPAHLKHIEKNSTIRNSDEKNKNKFLTKIWQMSWRLLASAVCFGSAILIGVLLVEFFDRGGGTIRVSAFIAPFAFVYYGFKLLIGFFKNLFSSNKKTDNALIIDDNNSEDSMLTLCRFCGQPMAPEQLRQGYDDPVIYECKKCMNKLVFSPGTILLKDSD